MHLQVVDKGHRLTLHKPNLEDKLGILALFRTTNRSRHSGLQHYATAAVNRQVTPL
jgi:hypothetical protein